MTATLWVSFQIGWCPPGRSIMLNRRIPSASPGARASPVRKPSSSGPRCRIAAAIARTRDSASALREANATPHIPHTLLFDLRSGKEGAARAHRVLAQMKARDSQPAVRIPGQQGAHQQEEQSRYCRDHQIKKGLALQEQAPIHAFIPPWNDPIQHAPEMQAVQRQPRQPHMRKMIEVVFQRVVRNRSEEHTSEL